MTKQHRSWNDDNFKAQLTLCSFDRDGGRQALREALKGVKTDRYALGPEVLAALVELPLDEAWLSSLEVLSHPPSWAVMRVIPGFDGEDDPFPIGSYADLEKLGALESLEWDLSAIARADLTHLVGHPTLVRVRIPEGKKAARKKLESAGFVTVHSTGPFGWRTMSKESIPKIAQKAFETACARLSVCSDRFEVRATEFSIQDGELRAGMWHSKYDEEGESIAFSGRSRKGFKRSYDKTLEMTTLTLLTAEELSSKDAEEQVVAKIEALHEHVKEHSQLPGPAGGKKGRAKKATGRKAAAKRKS